MNASEEKEHIKKEIFSGSDPEKQKLIDRLIELEGFKAMQFIQSLFLIDPFHRNPGSINLDSIAAYGVKKLLQLRAIESIQEFKFCPHCKSPLNKYDIIDPYAAGFKCVNNHRFHVDIQQNEFCDKSLKVNKDSDFEIAKEWLTNGDYRKNIHSQLAEILRKYIESKDLTNQIGDQNISNNYCPVCSFVLEEFKQDDIWVTGLKCINEHIFYSRNGLTYKNSTLRPDISEAIYYILIDNYLSEEQMEHVPDQIVTLFKAIKETSQ